MISVTTLLHQTRDAIDVIQRALSQLGRCELRVDHVKSLGAIGDDLRALSAFARICALAAHRRDERDANSPEEPKHNTGRPLSAFRAMAGIAFETTDLVLLQALADLYGMRMVIELDQSVDGREYEEIVAIYSKDSGRRRWSLWRSPDGVIVQPIIGRSVRFSTVTEAAEALWSIGSH